MMGMVICTVSVNKGHGAMLSHQELACIIIMVIACEDNNDLESV